MSIDAGDWLSLLHWWYVPHRFGKPLIVLLCRTVGQLPGDDVFKLTLIMAVIPAAITVMFTYWIALRLTNRISLAIVAALVLIGAVVFTTQAGVVEQYALTAMFTVMAFWFYLKGSKVGTLACLGLVTATHIIGVLFLLVWLFVHWRERKEWLKASWVYVVTGILPYGLIFLLMANPDVPRLHAGGLSWQSLLEYFLSGDSASAVLSLYEAPQRLLQMAQVALATLGVAIAPFVIGIKNMGQREKIVVGVIGCTAWFWGTALYPSVWKYACFFLPLMAAYVAVGLSRLPRWHTALVVVGAVVLIGVNGIYFNADKLAQEDPRASEYYQAVWELPDGAAVVKTRGGAYAFTLHYVLSQGKDIVPLPQFNPFDTRTNERRAVDQRHQDSLEWLERTYGVPPGDVFDLIAYAEDQGWEVYYGQPMTWIWSKMIETEDESAPSRIIGVNTEPDFTADWRYESE